MHKRALTYQVGDSPVHRCDARVKILVLLVFSIVVLLVRSWWEMGLLAVAAIVVIAVSRISKETINTMMMPVYALAAFSLLFNVAANPGFAGLSDGAFFGMRMLVLVAASFVVCLATPSADLLDAFRWFMGPLRHLGIPVDDIAFTLALSLRFIPVIETEFATVRAAQKSRGAELSGSFPNKLRIWGAAFSAVFVGLFRHADVLATAMDARCYGMRGLRPGAEKAPRQAFPSRSSAS